MYKSIGKIIKIIGYPFRMLKKGLGNMTVKIKSKCTWMGMVYDRLRKIPKKIVQRVKRKLRKIFKKK